MDWLSNLKTKGASLVKRNWKFKEHLTQDQLDRLANELPQYMHVEDEESKRDDRRVRKRKQVDPESIDVLCK